MHTLSNGGRLIDSPGVREFFPVINQTEDIQVGFKEIRAIADQCRFNNCLHLREPDCAVKSSVAANEIDTRRYESYKRLYHASQP